MNIYEQQASNRRTTALIMAAFAAFFLVIGLGFDYFYFNFGRDLPSIGGLAGTAYQETVAPGQYRGGGGNNVPFGTILALIVSAGLMLNSYFNGARMVLRSTMARRADPLNEREKQFINVVTEMATASGLPAPAAYIVPDQDLNAFATGTSPANSVVAVTEGLLASLNREELQAVVAHEMGHVRNYDIRLMTVVAALMGAIALLSDFAGRSSRYRTRSAYRGSSGGSDRRSGGGGAALLFLLWIVLVLLAPLISRILAMAISRQREFLADATGAELTRNPEGLISALEKIRAAVMPTNAVNNGVAHMCIADPRGSLIEEKSGFAADLLATHPPMEKRILALKAMAYRAGNPAPVRGM